MCKLLAIMVTGHLTITQVLMPSINAYGVFIYIYSVEAGSSAQAKVYTNIGHPTMT